MDSTETTTMVLAFLAAHPGASTDELWAASSQEHTSLLEWVTRMHRLGRSHGWGQDAAGRWWRHGDNPTVTAALDEHRMCPGHAHHAAAAAAPLVGVDEETVARNLQH